MASSFSKCKTTPRERRFVASKSLASILPGALQASRSQRRGRSNGISLEFLSWYSSNMPSWFFGGRHFRAPGVCLSSLKHVQIHVPETPRWGMKFRVISFRMNSLWNQLMHYIDIIITIIMGQTTETSFAKVRSNHMLASSLVFFSDVSSQALAEHDPHPYHRSLSFWRPQDLRRLALFLLHLDIFT